MLRSLSFAALTLTAVATPALAHPGHGAPAFHLHGTAGDIGTIAAAVLMIGLGVGLFRAVVRLIGRHTPQA